MQKNGNAGNNPTKDSTACIENASIVTLPPGCDAGFSEQKKNRKAEKLYAAALQWRANNPDVWEYWLARAKVYASRGEWFSMQALIEDARRDGHIKKGGSDFAVHQNLKTAFIRMICAEVPGAIKCVSLRSSIFEKARRERMESGA